MNRKGAEAAEAPMANMFELRRISYLYVPLEDAKDGNNDNGENKESCRSMIVISINQSH